MKNLKKLATTLALSGIIMMGVTNTQAGLLMSDFAGGGEQPCTIDVSVDNGIIVNDLTGIIVNDLAGCNTNSLIGLLISD